MNLKRFVKMMVTNPNSPKGIRISAEILEEKAEKLDGKQRDNVLLYARVLRILASKNYNVEYNRNFISEILGP